MIQNHVSIVAFMNQKSIRCIAKRFKLQLPETSEIRLTLLETSIQMIDHSTELD